MFHRVYIPSYLKFYFIDLYLNVLVVNIPYFVTCILVFKVLSSIFLITCIKKNHEIIHSYGYETAFVLGGKAELSLKCFVSWIFVTCGMRYLLRSKEFLHMFSLCTCGFPWGCLVSSHPQKHAIGLISYVKLPFGVNKCVRSSALYLCPILGIFSPCAQ